MLFHRLRSHVAVLGACVAFFAFNQFAVAQDFSFTDARSLPLFGKICERTFEPFSRLPESLKGVSREPVWGLGRNSAGLFVRFRSDAGDFKFRWTSTFKKNLDNMSAIGVRGLSLYVLDGGEWVFAGAARPNQKSEESEFRISCSKLKGRMAEYMLYLSLYDGVKELFVGVPSGRALEASLLNSPRSEKAVVMYGTSILQGCSASHPGMCSTNVLARRLDRVVVNLGFSGNALLDYEIAELMASYPDPGVFVLDNLPNGSPELTREKLEKFFRIIREAHPGVPVIFVENPIYPGVRVDAGREAFVVNKNKALKEVYERICKSGEKNLYYVKGDHLLPDGNVGTIEGTHFTDIGFAQYSNVLYPVIRKALKKTVR